MNSRLAAITLNTFREAVRDRVLYNLIAFVLLLVASAPLFGEISIGMERLIIINVGLSAISLFGTIIAIFIGIGLVSKEIEKRTLYTILSRPVRRWEFVAGKFFGLLLTLTVNTGLMMAGFFLALFMFAKGPAQASTTLVVAIYFCLLQFLMMTAITLLFSSFSTPIFSAIFAFALWIIGTFSEDLRNFAAMATGAAHWLATATAYVVPNFSSLNVINQAAHQQQISLALVAGNTAYALLYAGAAITGAILIFEWRNLK